MRLPRPITTGVGPCNQEESKSAALSLPRFGFQTARACRSSTVRPALTVGVGASDHSLGGTALGRAGVGHCDDRSGPVGTYLGQRLGHVLLPSLDGGVAGDDLHDVDGEDDGSGAGDAELGIAGRAVGSSRWGDHQDSAAGPLPLNSAVEVRNHRSPADAASNRGGVPDQSAGRRGGGDSHLRFRQRSQPQHSPAGPLSAPRSPSPDRLIRPKTLAEPQASPDPQAPSPLHPQGWHRRAGAERGRCSAAPGVPLPPLAHRGHRTETNRRGHPPRRTTPQQFRHSLRFVPQVP